MFFTLPACALTNSLRIKEYANSVNNVHIFLFFVAVLKPLGTNAGVARNPTNTTTLKQKKGLPPAHVQPMSVVVNLEPRRWLSQFFAGLLDKTEKNGTVPADWVCANPKAMSSTHASFPTNNHLQFAAETVPLFLSARIQHLVFYSGYDPIRY